MRLSASKRLAAQFFQERKDDRIGLVGFERETRVLSPVTDDHSALEKLIQKMDNGLDGLPDGTAIGAGLGSAVNLLRGSHARSRVIILLTDGEENVHQIEPDEAAKLAKTLGIRIYTVGIVDARAGGAFLGVDEKQLTTIAETTGGSFFSATNPQALADVYQRINNLEKSRVERFHYLRFDELAPWLMAPALLLILLEALLANTVFRRTP